LMDSKFSALEIALRPLPLPEYATDYYINK